MKYIYSSKKVSFIANALTNTVVIAVLVLGTIGTVLQPALTKTAYAATNTLYDNPTSTGIAFGSFINPLVDASGHHDLQLSFDYDAENMDDGDSFDYSWSIGSSTTFTPLGSVTGQDEGTAGDESGSVVNASLPAGAEVANLRLNFENNSNNGSDTVYVSNITLTGVQDVDTTGPTITNTTPVDGAVISGSSYIVSADVTDPSGVNSVDYNLRYVGEASNGDTHTFTQFAGQNMNQVGSSDTYQATLDTTGLPTARAYLSNTYQITSWTFEFDAEDNSSNFNDSTLQVQNVTIDNSTTPTPVPTTPYSNGFETSATDWAGSVTSVPSGTDGISAAGGSHYAQVSEGSYTYWNNVGANVFPSNGYTSEVDVYLDMSEADGVSSKRIFWNGGISNISASNLEETSIVLQTNPSTANQWQAQFRITGPFHATPLVDITETGWYTLQRHYYEHTDGYLYIEQSVLDADETIITSHTFGGSEYNHVVDSEVGGPDYGWFPAAYTDFSTVIADNACLYLGAPVANSCGFTTDAEGPDVTFTAPSPGEIVGNTNISFEITDATNISQYGFLVNGPGSNDWNTRKWHPNTTSVSVSDLNLCAEDRLNNCDEDTLPSGTYKVRVAAYDGIGNRNISTNTTFVLDKDGPSVTVTGPAASSTVNEVLVDGTVQDQKLNYFNINLNKLGDSDWNFTTQKIQAAPGQTTYTLNNFDLLAAAYYGTCDGQPCASWAGGTLPDGDYKLRINAYDEFGNRTIYAHTFTLDATAPTVPSFAKWLDSLGGSELGAFTNQTLVFPTWGASNDGSGSGVDHYEYSYFAPYSVGWSSPTNVGNVLTRLNSGVGFGSPAGNEGDWRFRVRAVDTANNVSSWTTSSVVTFDKTAPIVTVGYITSVEEGELVNVTGTVDDSAITNVEVFVDGVSQGTAAVVANAFDFDITGLAAGTYSIEVAAADAAGNDGSAVKTAEVTAPANTGGGAFAPANATGGNNDTATEVAIVDNNADNGTNATDGQNDDGEEEGNNEEVAGVTTDGTDDGNTLATSTDDKQGCSEILGICWYLWTIPVVGIAIYIYFRFYKADEK